MSSSLAVQVLNAGEPAPRKLVHILIAETTAGVSLGIHSDEEWTDDDGHANFSTPDYDDYDGKYVWITVSGDRHGPWDLVDDAGYTIDLASDDD